MTRKIEVERRLKIVSLHGHEGRQADCLQCISPRARVPVAPRYSVRSRAGTTAQVAAPIITCGTIQGLAWLSSVRGTVPKPLPALSNPNTEKQWPLLLDKSQRDHKTAVCLYALGSHRPLHSVVGWATAGRPLYMYLAAPDVTLTLVYKRGDLYTPWVRLVMSSSDLPPDGATGTVLFTGHWEGGLYPLQKNALSKGVPILQRNGTADADHRMCLLHMSSQHCNRAGQPTMCMYVYMYGLDGLLDGCLTPGPA